MVPTRTARADEPAPPRARAGMEGGLGFARAGPTWVGGAGVALSGGLQATRWLGFEALVFGETGVVFYGRGHLAGLVTFTIDRLTVGLGGGVGALYALNYGASASTASFGLGVLRLEIAFDRRSEGGHFALGAEGVLGSTFAGNVTVFSENLAGERGASAYPLAPGTPMGGARIFFGLRY
jgi:hypothetical protein